MKRISIISTILFVTIGLISSLASCCGYPEPTEWEFYSVKNNSSDTIYVWDYLCSPDMDVLKMEYPIYEFYHDTIAPGERKEGLYMGIPREDLNVHFKYKPEMDYSNENVVNLIILKKETYDKYTLEELVENKIYDAKYVLRKIEILNMGYVVNYQ